MNPTENWDRKYLGLAKYVAETWSKDPSTKVGAVVVNYDYNQEFIGYNGFPKGVQDLPERYTDRELKYKLVVHAEVNAILKAGKLAKGATLYVYPSFSLPPVCNECAKLVIQSGIKEVVSFEPDPLDPRVKRWADSISISKTMFEEAGVTWRTLKED
jgi:dCMP deaminase